MPKPRILFDIDNVLADSDTPFRRLIAEATGGRVALDNEDVARFNYHENKDKGGRQCTREEWNEAHARYFYPEEQARLMPVPGAIEGLMTLSEMFGIVIATSRPQLARVATIDWLDRYLYSIPYELYFPGHRMKHNMGNLLAAVEDDYEQARLFAGAGVPCCLLSYPWNSDPSRCPQADMIPRFAGWEALLGRLLDATTHADRLCEASSPDVRPVGWAQYFRWSLLRLEWTGPDDRVADGAALAAGEGVGV